MNEFNELECFYLFMMWWSFGEEYYSWRDEFDRVR